MGHNSGLSAIIHRTQRCFDENDQPNTFTVPVAVNALSPGESISLDLFSGPIDELRERVTVSGTSTPESTTRFGFYLTGSERYSVGIDTSESDCVVESSHNTFGVVEGSDIENVRFALDCP